MVTVLCSFRRARDGKEEGGGEAARSTIGFEKV